jgi:hypothetical protein
MSANVPQVLGEDENTYTLANPNGGAPIRVAKTPGIVAMMQASAPAPAVATPAAAPTAPIDLNAPLDLGAAPPVAPGAWNPATLRATPVAPAAPSPAATQPATTQIFGMSPGDLASKAGGVLKKIAGAEPVDASPTTPQAPAIPKPAGGGAAASAYDPSKIRFAPGPVSAGGAIGGAVSDFGERAALKKIDEGETDRAAAIASEGADTGKILHDAGAAADALKTTSDTQIGENQSAIDLAQKAVDTYKIDRNHLWSSKSTGQKIKAGISIMLGALGQGLGGGPNEGIRAIDDAIARDVADQQDALASKKGAVEALEKKGIRLDHLAALQTAALWQAADHKIAERVAMAKGPEAIAAAKAASGEVHMKYAEARQALAERLQAAEARATNKPGGQEIAEGESLVDDLAAKAGLRWNPRTGSYEPIGDPSSGALGTGSSVAGYLPSTKTGQYLTARRGTTTALMKRFSPEAQKSIGDSLFPSGGAMETTASQIAQFNNTRGLMSNGAMVKNLASPGSGSAGAP